MTAVHRLLQRQLKKSSKADGNIDLDILLGLVSKTYTEDEDDSRRTDRSIQLMVDEIDAANRVANHTSEQLQVTLEAVRHGIMMVSATGQIDVCNAKARELLKLPEGPLSLAGLKRHLEGVELLEQDHGDTALVAMAEGRFVEIHVQPTAEGGTVILVQDVTEDRNRERALRQAESEYRSLFTNSVYGIYRDTLEGLPVRVNPALAAINGYASEEEQIAAVRGRPSNWYVDPARPQFFLDTLRREGRVRDLVSEVYRHKTGERLWVTENAWYVNDANGNPLFVEGTIQDATERMNAEAVMNRLANVDTLTGAKSRFRFMQRLQEEVSRPGGEFALYIIDLDMFKDVNDVFGHATGDALLQAVTARLNSLTGGESIVARLGGDEFAVMSSVASVLENSEALAQNIVEALRAPVMIDGRNHHIGASVGIAEFPKHGATGEELLKHADTALYQAKSAGRSGWRLFDHELRTVLERRKEIEDNLREAGRRGELEFHYQPVVAMTGGAISGFEGLMRWTSSRLGPVSPSEFIPIAERAGLMTALGEWAITRACEDASTFDSAVRFGVNLSANQFRAPGFLAHLEKELKRHGVAPERLVLEITESVLVSHEAAARSRLNDLRHLGVQIAIDDFGTGYSSLSYLQHLPINTVKIDRSFVAGIVDQRANRAVIRAILGIGRELGFKIIAEGVETEEQAEALLQEGCEYAQGYLYSRPKPLVEVTADYAVGRLGRPSPTLVRKTA